MRAKEMRERDAEELDRMLKDTRTEHFRLRLKNATHQLDNTSELNRSRKEIARILTVIRERGLAQSEQPTVENSEE